MGDQVPHIEAQADSGPEDECLAASNGQGLPWRPHHAGRTPGAVGFHRAVRLTLATGAAGAGVCMVLGLMALVIKLGPSGSSAPSADMRGGITTAPHNHAERSGQHSGDAVIASFHGDHRSANASFRVPTPGAWGLSWTFSCENGGAGRLMVRENKAASGRGLEIDASGRSGQGTTWQALDRGRYSLAIMSDCSWTVQVVGPRSAADRQQGR